MKKLLMLGLTLTMSFAATFSAYAEYVPSNGFNANLVYNTRLYDDLEKAKEEKEELEDDIEKFEKRLSDMQEAYEEAERVCNELEEEGNIENTQYRKSDELRRKYLRLGEDIELYKRLLEEKESLIETLEEHIADVTEDNMEWTGYVPDGTEGDTYTFKLRNTGDEWLLVAGYRSWNSALGGHWEYSSFIIPSLDISFYDGDICLSSSLDRAESEDTETGLAWYVPDDIENGKRYYIEVNGKRYGVVARNFSDSTDPISSGSGSSGSGNTHSSQTKGWYQENGLWKVNDSLGNLIVNAWFCDLDGSWYLLDERGYMREGIINNNGHYYSLETDHNGYYGRMRTIDGVYNGVELKFNQEHNGYYGEIISGLDKLISTGITVTEVYTKE